MSIAVMVRERVSALPVCGYDANGVKAAEPTAIAALALHSHGAARAALDWLAARQAPDGSVPVIEGQSTPAWTTSLAVLAWVAANRSLPDSPYRQSEESGARWLLATRGESVDASEDVGHDAKLVGWPWVSGTHSWLEPTALAVLALRASGQNNHPRTREAVRLLLDRQLPGGGCNYGNTLVLGQELRPHLQPTGIAMLALGGERELGREDRSKVERSLDYLLNAAPLTTAAASLAWARLGLLAHGRDAAKLNDALAVAARRTLDGGRSSHRLALLALAENGLPEELIYGS